jgi:Ca2+/Na+ antiporter
VDDTLRPRMELSIEHKLHQNTDRWLHEYLAVAALIIIIIIIIIITYQIYRTTDVWNRKTGRFLCLVFCVSPVWPL